MRESLGQWQVMRESLGRRQVMRESLGQWQVMMKSLGCGQVMMESLGRRQVERWRVNDVLRNLVKLVVPVLLLKVALLEVAMGLVKLVLHRVLGRWNGEVVVGLGNVLRRRWRRKVLYLCNMLKWWV